MVQKINLTKNVTIELTPLELQIIIGLLNKGIFEQVAPIIKSIETQVLTQVTTKPADEIKPETN